MQTYGDQKEFSLFEKEKKISLYLVQTEENREEILGEEV